MPEKACQNPLTSPVWPKKGSCPPGDSSLFLCLGVGRGDIFPNRKNRWRKARRARGQHGLPWGPPQKGRGAGMVRRQGGALCVVGYRLVHGYVDAREAVGGEGRGSGGWAWRAREIAGRGGQWYRPGESLGRRGRGVAGGRARRGKGDCGKGGAVVSPRRITLRKGARGGGWQGAAGQGRLREGRGGGIASENHFEEGSAGWTGAAGQERLREGAGGGRTRWEPARRKNAGQKEKGGRGRLTCGIWSSAKFGSPGRAARRA